MCFRHSPSRLLYSSGRFVGLASLLVNVVQSTTAQASMDPTAAVFQHNAEVRFTHSEEGVAHFAVFLLPKADSPGTSAPPRDRSQSPALGSASASPSASPSPTQPGIPSGTSPQAVAPQPPSPEKTMRVPIPPGISELRLIGSLPGVPRPQNKQANAPAEPSKPQNSANWIEPIQYPTFFFSAKNCAASPCQPQILSIRPGTLPPGTQAPQPTPAYSVHSYVFPGRINDSRTGEVVFESRAFFGRCLPRFRQGYVSFQREKIDRKKGLVSSVFVAEAPELPPDSLVATGSAPAAVAPPEGHLHETLIEKRHLPKIKSVIPFIKLNQCKEISGVHRSQLRRPLDLKPRHTLPESDDEDAGETPEPAN